MEQDRNLELQRSRERLEQIADLATAQLARNLGDWDFGLRELNSLPPSPSLAARLPAHATLVVVTRDSVRSYPQRPLVFVPSAPVAAAVNPDLFDAADELELREQQFDRAIAALTPLANQSASRAEALLRIARIQRKANHPDAALATYTSLERESGLSTTGTPYSLLASNAKCRLLTELGRRKEASAEAEFIHAELLRGRWALSREAFEYQWSELDRLGVWNISSACGPPDWSWDNRYFFDCLKEPGEPKGTGQVRRVSVTDGEIRNLGRPRQGLDHADFRGRPGTGLRKRPTD